MRTKKTTFILGGLLLAVASAAAGCSPPPPPPLTPASAELGRMAVFVDPDVAVVEVASERGRDLLAPFHDALATALSDAGYHVVTASTAPHDLTIHVKVGRIGYTYGAWADHVAVEVSAGDKPLAQLTRASLNFVHIEGADTPARLTFAAHALVNALGKEASVQQYAASVPGSAGSGATSPPASTAPGVSGTSPTAGDAEASGK